MRITATLASALSLVLTCSLPLLAGQPPPCVKAASSENANSLVISDVQLELPEGEMGIAKIIQFSFDVFPREKFSNAKDRTTVPATFWAGSGAQWRIVLASGDKENWAFVRSCPLPLVTDDGEFLILLAAVPAMSDDWGVMRIYRWDRTSSEIPGHARLIREIPLREIWPPLRLTWPPGAPENPRQATDETPQWYAGGTFAFSLDNRNLVHKTQWGNTIKINLENGPVSNE
jgi:hypothetical protein